MKTISLKNNELYILGISALLITLLLFFIDEGHYDFNWTSEPFVWIVFLLYVLPIFFGQLLMSKVMLKKISHPKKIALSIFLGSVLGITCTVSILLSGFWK